MKKKNNNLKHHLRHFVNCTESEKNDPIKSESLESLN